jgi:predicted amidohydrolase YtcJ
MQAQRLAEGRLPTRFELDAALPDHPAYVTFGAHVLVANSRAIEGRGIGPTTPEPDRGVIERDPTTGEPTGIFLERAGALITGRPGTTAVDRLEDAIEAELHRCLERGVTTIHDIVADPSEVRAYQSLRRAGRLPLRVAFIVRVVHSGFVDHPPLALGLVPGFGDDRLWFAGVKMSVDGGFTGGNAAFAEPLGGGARSGLIRIPGPELDALVDRYDQAGIRISVHAMGDVALDMALAAFARRGDVADLTGRRHRIEHMGNWLCTASRLAEARRLGVVPVPNPSMRSNLADEIGSALGEARAATAFQFRSILEAGLPLVFGSDGPGYWSVDPLRDIAAATSHATRTGTRIGDPTTVSVLDALVAQTRTAAWLGFREHELGTLAPGMLADLVVLDQDPLDVNPDRIGALRVDMTIVGGRIAFERDR